MKLKEYFTTVTHHEDFSPSFPKQTSKDYKYESNSNKKNSS
jgi:hypothetical protein